MKKTDKIEIRVTPEEKQGLMDLAHSEGRSLSELIRGILGTYVEAQTSKASTSKQRINHMLKSKKSWSLGGLIASAFAIAFVTAPAQADGTYKLSMDIIDPIEGSTETNSYNWSKDLNTTSISEAPFVITSSTGTAYELTIALTELEDDIVFAEFTICKKIDRTCETVAEPSLQFTKSDPAEIVIGGVVETGEADQIKMIDGFAIKIAHTQP